MDNVLKYYDFSDFFSDKSGVFSNNSICYSELNETHFLIFEKSELHQYNLYISKYASDKDIGLKSPEGISLIQENYDKSIPEHRLLLKKYLY